MDWVTNPRYPRRLELDSFSFFIYYKMQDIGLAPKYLSWAYSMKSKMYIVTYMEGMDIYRYDRLAGVKPEMMEFMKKLHDNGMCFRGEVTKDDFQLYKDDNDGWILKIVSPEKVDLLPVVRKPEDEFIESDEQMIHNMLGSDYEWIVMDLDELIIRLKAWCLGLAPAVLEYKAVQYTKKGPTSEDPLFRVKIQKIDGNHIYMGESIRKAITKALRRMHIMGISIGHINTDSIVVDGKDRIKFLDWTSASWVYPGMSHMDAAKLWEEETKNIKDMVLSTDLFQLYKDKVLDKEDEKVGYELGPGCILLPDRAVWD